MARLVGVDLPRNKRMVIALTYIYGIGPTRSAKILAACGISQDLRTDDLTGSTKGSFPSTTATRTSTTCPRPTRSPKGARSRGARRTPSAPPATS